VLIDRAFRSALLTTLVSLGILVSLGVWQVHRLHWKGNLLAQIDAAEAAPPVMLGAAPRDWARVVAHGILLPATAYYGVQVRDMPDGRTQIGAQLLRVMRRDGLPPLLVDMGWLPEGAAVPPPPHAAVDVTGYVRAADHAGWLSAADDPASYHFYSLDPAVIGPAMGVADLAPFTLIAMGAPAGPGLPVPADALPRPQNNHLQYAFTWFGIAAALVGVFVSWAVGRSRPSR
jgi:surfeit locus 1 family protein